MAKTMDTAVLDACQEIAQNVIVEGIIASVSDLYGAALTISWALSNATAHTGTKIRIEQSPRASGDEAWGLLQELIVGVGTTNLEVITNNPAAVAETVITCASTTGYSVGSTIFLEDVSTFANSEWGEIKAMSANTSVTLVDGITRQHAVNSILNSVAGVTPPIPIPVEEVQRVRVLYDNTYDADGATVAVKCEICKQTAY